MKKKLTAPERFVLLRDFDYPWSALHNRNLTGCAEVGLSRFVRLLTRNATPLAPPARH